jgi:hypothetical protein
LESVYEASKSCFNDVENVRLIEFNYPEDGSDEVHRAKYFESLSRYAERVTDRDGI